jgi:hypothetical protein
MGRVFDRKLDRQNTYPVIDSSGSNNLSLTCDQERKQQERKGEMMDEHGVDTASLENSIRIV